MALVFKHFSDKFVEWENLMLADLIENQVTRSIKPSSENNRNNVQEDKYEDKPECADFGHMT